MPCCGLHGQFPVGHWTTKSKIKAQYNFLSVGFDYLIDLVLYSLDSIESASYFGWVSTKTQTIGSEAHMQNGIANINGDTTRMINSTKSIYSEILKTKFILGLHYCSSIPIVRMKHFGSEMNLNYIRKPCIWVQIHVKRVKHIHTYMRQFVCWILTSTWSTTLVFAIRNKEEVLETSTKSFLQVWAQKRVKACPSSIAATNTASVLASKHSFWMFWSDLILT